MKFFIIIFSLTFMSCCYSPSPYKYEYIADKITRKTILQLKEEKKLSAIGIGGRMLGDIQVMDIDFNYYHKVDITEARSLLVSAIQAYLKNINESKELRPFLHNYPATLKDIEITIFVYQEDRKQIMPGEIEIIQCRKDKLFYKLARDKPLTPWPILKEESYEEALQLLGQE